MLDISTANLIVYCAQLLIVVALAAATARAIDVPLPRVRLAYWRAVVILCLALPLLSFVQPAPPETPRSSTPSASPVVAQPASLAATTVEPSAAAPLGTYVVALLLTGIWLRGAWLAVGFARLRRFRRDAVPIDLGESVTRLRDEIAPHADIRACGHSTQPATFGFWRPIIVLPEAVEAMPPAERLAIVCHELLHVRRRDWIWTLAEEAIRTVFWFHPAMRYAISHVQGSREEVIDTEVIMRTGNRRDYMRALFAFAEAPAVMPAAAFVRPGQLSSRLRRMTEEVCMSPQRVRLVVSTLAVVLIAAIVLSARAVPYEITAAEQQEVVPPQNAVQFSAPVARAIVRMDRPKYPVDAWRAGIGAEVTALVQVDPNGIVTIRETPTWRITVTDASPAPDVQSFWARQGWRDFVDSVTDAINQWQYVPGDSPVTTTVRVTFSNRVPGAMALTSTATPSGGAGRTREPAQPPVRVGGAVRPPTKIINVPPIYPEDARAARVQGVVIIEALIGTDGVTYNTRVLRSIPLLDKAALDAVSQWRFTPTYIDGVARDVLVTMTVNFTLQ